MMLATCTFISICFMHNWVMGPVGAFFFTFIQVFAIWSLNFTAFELENPFGCDDHDIDLRSLQHAMDQKLRMIIKPKALRHPELAEERKDSDTPYHGQTSKSIYDA